MERTLTITISQDWKNGLSNAMHNAFAAKSYQGEYLNFASPALFFGKLTNNRWSLIGALQGAGEVGVRELARRLDRDVKRVHEDAAALVELGLIEKTERGGLLCPYSDVHVDMHLRKAA